MGQCAPARIGFMNLLIDFIALLSHNNWKYLTVKQAVGKERHLKLRKPGPELELADSLQFMPLNWQWFCKLFHISVKNVCVANMRGRTLLAIKGVGTIGWSVVTMLVCKYGQKNPDLNFWNSRDGVWGLQVLKLDFFICLLCFSCT